MPHLEPRPRALGGAVLAIALSALGPGGCSCLPLDDLSGGGGEAPGSTSTGEVSTSASTSSGGGTTSATSSTSGATGGGGAGGSGAGSGGAGGAGGDGGASEPLVDTGLLVRYFVAEAERGTGPTHLLDAAPTPLDLSLDYADGMHFASPEGHRGLTWDLAGEEGLASSPVAGTKVVALDGSIFGTIEVVADVRTASTYGSRLLHVGTGSDSTFTMAVSPEAELPELDAPTLLQLRTITFEKGLPVYRYGYGLADFSVGRTVLHAVYDTREEVPADRVRFYQDGARLALARTKEPLPELEEALVVDPADLLTLGNRLVGDRSIEGTIFYAAMYLAALTEDEISHNVALLGERDDP